MLVDTIPATCAHGRMILPLFQEIALRNKRICSSRHAPEIDPIGLYKSLLQC